MVMRFDPFRDLDRLAQQAFGEVVQVRSIPMDAYRRGDVVFLHFDLPGIDPTTIDLTVEQNVLSVTAERLYDRKEGDQIIAKERAARQNGVFPMARRTSAPLARSTSLPTGCRSDW